MKQAEFSFPSAWLWLAICLPLLTVTVGCRAVALPWDGMSASVSEKREMDLEGRLLVGEAEKGLAVGIRALPAQGPFAVEVYLRNDSGRPLTVYRSFRIDTGQFDADSDLFFDIRDAETGRKASLRQQSKAWTDGRDHHNPRSYYQMHPGEVVSGTISLDRFYDLDVSGKYQVVVDYDHNQSGYEVRGNWVELDAWTGRCKSGHLRLPSH